MLAQMLPPLATTLSFRTTMLQTALVKTMTMRKAGIMKKV
jgi:hypothetical protein